ncbi:hypothetical protein T459_01228 [Capsicum annuum]|uniref:Uncharacterized protein n=1 Tax=Capsicum annuum TaxID=4072 RepID=A0A2G3AGH6_CAPAN|nr:hypothetical protein T459_01228 [Capsicum annuum]
MDRPSFTDHLEAIKFICKDFWAPLCCKTIVFVSCRECQLILLQARSKLRHHIAAVQVSIGLEHDFKALIHFMQSKTYCFHGYNESALSLA